MGKFKQSLITTAGKSILLGGEVTYTSAKLFSQDVSSMTDDQVRALTALTGQLMSVGVSVEAMDNSTVSVKAVFSNKGLTNDLTFSSVGWFAKAGSGTETLIAVTPIEGTKLLCAGLPNSSTDAINIAMNMAIGDSTTVNVVIDPAGTVSPVDLDSAISKIQTDVDTKATKADVDKEITTLTADKANISDVYTKSDVDSALAADRGRLGKLEGVQTLDSPDFNSITNTGVYYITNNTTANIKNNPVSQWGVLVVVNGDGGRISQVYYPDDDSAPWYRVYGASNWLPWYQLSTKKDVSNATDLANQAQTTADTKANSADVYTKTDIDNKIAPLGTVKKVADISPNDDGNVPIKIGGANLAHDSVTFLGTNIGNTKKFSFTTDSGNNYGLAAIPLDVSFKKGDIFTISFDSTLTGSQVKDGWVTTTIFNNDYSYCYDDNKDTVYIKSGNPGSKTIVVNADSDPSEPPLALVYAGIAGSTGGNTLTVENFKIERGNIPTDYSLPLGEISTEVDITSLQNTVNNIDSTRTPIVAGASGDDLFAFKTNQIRLYSGNGKACKNLPPAANTQYFTVQYVFETPNEDGIAIYRTPSNEIWTAGCNAGSYDHSWVRVANSTDITSLQNVVNGKANSTDVTNLQSMITGLSTTVDSATTKLQGQITEIQSKNYIEGYNCANESDAETYSKAHPTTLVTVS